MRSPRGGAPQRELRSQRDAMRGFRGVPPQRVLRSQLAVAAGDVSWPSSPPIQSHLDYSGMPSAVGRRDSDATSICSSLPSAGGRSAFSTASNPSDCAFHLRAVNSYLASLSPPVHLKPPLPPARDIAEAFSRLFSCIEFDKPFSDFTRDLPPLVAALRCPYKLSKSALKAPSTPHAWPSVLAVLHWLVQLARVSDHVASSLASPQSPDYDINRYITRSYSLFLVGDDSAVAGLDAEYKDRIERHVASAVTDIEARKVEVAQLEAKIRDLEAKASPLEALEAQRAMLLADANKFENVMDKFSELIEEKRQRLAETENDLEKREVEKKRLDEENEQLRQRIREQLISKRDLERMTRELKAVEEEVVEAEGRRNEVEEKEWALDSEVKRKLREIEAIAEQCNQDIRKLKIGNNFLFVLNPKGSSASEVIGIGYKTLLKPALNTLMEETKKSNVLKAEEVINLQKESLENDMMLDRKRDRYAAIQTRNNEIEARIGLIKKEIEDQALESSSEIESKNKAYTIKEEQLSIMERDAQKLLMGSEEKLKRAIAESTEETNLCALALATLIDSITQHKKFMESTIDGIGEEVKGLIEFMKQSVEASLPHSNR